MESHTSPLLSFQKDVKSIRLSTVILSMNHVCSFQKDVKSIRLSTWTMWQFITILFQKDVKSIRLSTSAPGSYSSSTVSEGC